MQLSTDLAPNTDFTRILNAVIFDDNLSHAEFRLWCRLLAMPKGANELAISIEEVAKRLNVSTTCFRKQRQNLKDKGYLIIKGGRVLVTVPGASFTPAEPKLTKGQQLREDLKGVWNSSKPDSYTRLRSSFSLDQVDTLKLHAEHNNEKSLPQFLSAVLRGCKTDDWWKDKTFKPDNIFGTGTPKQNKFTNVEKLFKLSSSRKGKAVAWDINDDQCWIDWFHSKNATEYTKVERCSAPGREEAYLHNLDNPPAPDTIRVYQTETGFPCFWTKDSDPRFVAHQLPSRA